MRKILVVDDEPDVVKLMELFLSSLGYETDIFLSCEETIEAVQENKYWAVFCDYMMPSVTGDKLYYRIKEKDSELAKRFIMVTGAVLDERLEDFVKKEGIWIISKPFKLDEVKNILMEFEKN
jgi:CheY-like chemotaxis protein